MREIAARSMSWLEPAWAAPATVAAMTTLRRGGTSVGPFGDERGESGMNLGLHCGDDAESVLANRQHLQQGWLPAPPVWLRQVHGIDVWDGDLDGDRDGDLHGGSAPADEPVADAAVTSRPGQVLAVLTADCLPVFLCSQDGAAVGIAHAGWRGLAAGVIERTVAQLRARSGQAPLLAAFGPSIGPAAFEVGDDVRQAFCDLDPDCATAFAPGLRAGKWWGDLYALARRRLALAGVDRTSGGGLCTLSDPQRFYSYRRSGRTGRMASLIWIKTPGS